MPAAGARLAARALTSARVPPALAAASPPGGQLPVGLGLALGQQLGRVEGAADLHQLGGVGRLPTGPAAARRGWPPWPRTARRRPRPARPPRPRPGWRPRSGRSWRSRRTRRRRPPGRPAAPPRARRPGRRGRRGPAPGAGAGRRRARPRSRAAPPDTRSPPAPAAPAGGPARAGQQQLLLGQDQGQVVPVGRLLLAGGGQGGQARDMAAALGGPPAQPGGGEVVDPPLVARRPRSRPWDGNASSIASRIASSVRLAAPVMCGVCHILRMPGASAGRHGDQRSPVRTRRCPATVRPRRCPAGTSQVACLRGRKLSPRRKGGLCL